MSDEKAKGNKFVKGSPRAVGRTSGPKMVGKIKPATSTRRPTFAKIRDKADAELPKIPDAVRELLGAPPLTSWENGRAYNILLRRIAADFRPKDALEWIWVKDLVDLVWEARRLRRVKLIVIMLARKSALVKLLHTVPDDADRLSQKGESERLAIKYLIGDDEGMANLVKYMLKKMDAKVEDIEAQAYFIEIRDVERLDRLASNCDKRRDDIVREIYKRRDSLGPKLKNSFDYIDAEFKNVKK